MKTYEIKSNQQNKPILKNLGYFALLSDPNQVLNLKTKISAKITRNSRTECYTTEFGGVLK